MLWRTRRRLREFLEGSIWPIPVVVTVLSYSLIDLTVRVDRELPDDVVPGFTSATATALLAAIAGAMITFTGFVFSVLLVVVQFASAQLTPRVLRVMYRDRLLQVSLGVFVGTFVFALGLLEEVRDQLVPAFSISIAILMVLASVILFIALISRIAGRLRPARIARDVGAHGLAAARADHRRARRDASPGTAPWTPPPDQEPQRVHPDTEGVLIAVDHAGLTRAARKHHAVIVMTRGIGDYADPVLPLFEVHGGRMRPTRLLAHCIIRDERSLAQDPAFGLRILVDIANKALSPGVNDPTTAVQVLDRIELLLGALVRQPLGRRERRDQDGSVRLVVPEPSWDDLLALGVTEIRLSGAGDVQVARRLRALLENLLSLDIDAARADSLLRELTRLERSVDRAYADPADRAAASVGDLQGLGLSRSPGGR